MKRAIIALLAAAALTLPAMAQSGQRDTMRGDTNGGATMRSGDRDRDFDRQRGGMNRDSDRRRSGMNRDFDRRYSSDRGRRGGYAFSRTYREHLGSRTARNRTSGESRSSRY